MLRHVVHFHFNKGGIEIAISFLFLFSAMFLGILPHCSTIIYIKVHPIRLGNFCTVICRQTDKIHDLIFYRMQPQKNLCYTSRVWHPFFYFLPGQQLPGSPLTTVILEHVFVFNNRSSFTNLFVSIDQKYRNIFLVLKNIFLFIQ